MVYVNKEGYLERNPSKRKNPNSKPTKRDWWFIKYDRNKRNIGYLQLKLYIPSRYVSKRIRFKIEVWK